MKSALNEDVSRKAVEQAEIRLSSIRNEMRTVARKNGNDDLLMYAEDLWPVVLKLRDALES